MAETTEFYVPAALQAGKAEIRVSSFQAGGLRPPMAKSSRLSEVSLYKGTTPITSCKPDYLPEAPISDTITFGV